MAGRFWFSHFVLALVFWGCSSKESKKDNPQQDVAQLPVGDPQVGKTLYATCITCHGDAAQGNEKLKAPALANTDNWYLYRQLMNFRNGIRGYQPADTSGYQMAAMAKTLKDSLAVSHVVAYIKTLPQVELPSIVKGDLKKGERTYQSICGSCHGPGARGNEKMNAPRLNGLEDWYLKSQIAKFRNALRGAHPADKFGAQMVPMVTLLADEQAVNDVIAYIRSTTQPAKE
ncbi:c-type cytochrome [Chryseolinea lacunae]|uniref:C-type cytochrome n=1 Tax=Chryseolinea lacunae TaxID=2801331 RepID=A0ABS1L1P4_9BACT|nr:cytochrome c [Chryseolinea lacunae]MBL0745634.1 c-type cytochrome [Chryseolinea lacunae]